MAWPARAQTGASEASASTLLLVRSAGDDRVVPRIVADLAASGWNVVEVGPDVQLDRSALSELATTHAAIAALRVRASDSTMELWIARAAGASEGTLETLSAADTDERVPALRVTEALRARGLIAPRSRAAAAREEAPAQPKPQPEAPAKPQAEPEREAAAPAAPSEPEEEERDEEDEEQDDEEAEAAQAYEPETPPRPLPPFPRMWFEIAPALAISAGDTPPAIDAFVSLRYQPASHWSVALLGLVPIWSERVRAPEGSARLSTLLVGLGADLHVQSGRLELGLRGGAGAAFTFMRGTAHDELRGVDDTVVVAAVFAGPSVHFHLGGGFRLALRALGGVALPRVAVRFAEHDVAHWGRPFGVATLGLEYAF